MSAEASSVKYLIFSLNKEYYGIPISKVREVIRFVNITPVHETLKFIKGVINLRGKIIPIIDMRLKFGLQENQYNDRTIFIIVDIHGVKSVFNMGITVESVHDVTDINEETMEKAPEIGLKLKSQYLSGIAKIKDKMIMLLNMDRILTTEDVILMKDFQKNE
ncbi:MAG: chemotaxis protein CheW [Spirochaetes bacterium GWB1_36_13]|nr:MAG: chemotaxis protein CheW [Spirochaetes bacterium GWB1_36_13]